ncbi:MAG: efflux RND transporter periplasmic adaptor subunit [Anaeromyxobacter sp.]|nr:efflux RND transporter periplasmic adaptor subunit [Anaeromyxobacter sp.]MBL0274927.1 efflux RND transporter periplasmic adaptor subunit [Anaeromyxobacter sp.]
MSKRTTILAALATLALVAGAGWAWRGSGPPKSEYKLETARAERGRIVAKVTATGTLSAIVTVQVGSQVSGRVSALHADFNSRVEKGALIAEIDPQLFQASVEQARANLAAAQGNLARARAQAADALRQAARARTLADRQLVATADADTAQSNADALAAGVQAAEGQVAQARASLSQAQVNLAYTAIRSPTSGVVISRNVDVGQTVAASLQAPTIFVIAEDLAKMQVDTSVAEADVGRLKDGTAATFTVDAYPSEIFRGTVRQIRNSPQTVQNVVTYDAVIDVANPDLKLKPGMTANVTFVYAEKEDVLKVPNAALRFKPPPALLGEGGSAGGAAGAGPDAARAGGRPAGGRGQETPDRRTVWVLKEGKPSPIRIRTGISDGSATEVLEGDLQAGGEVITDSVGPPSGMAAAMRRPL